MGKYILVDGLDWKIIGSFNKVYSKILIDRTDCDAFGLSIQKVGYEGEVPKHSHKEKSLYYFLEGSGQVYLGEETIEIQPGLVVYISSNEIHGLENTGTEILKYIEIKSPNTL